MSTHRYDTDRDESVVRCNCENSLCPHGLKGCENKARKGSNKIQMIGTVCNDCYTRYPKEYRAENEPKRPPMECSTCHDRGKRFVTTDFKKFWDHVDEHRHRREEPLR